MKTYSPKLKEIGHDWYLVDAKEQTLGRLSSRLATILIGKHKPNYAPHMDSGDNLIVINASAVKVTGSKLTNKRYYRHSGYPGGIKEITLADQLKKDPAKVISDAVYGMLPANRLRAGRMARLRVYAGTEHPHLPQQPKTLSFKEAKHG
jgi:large subunit ribosomal protein L13